MIMAAMTIRASLAAVLIVASIRWSGAAYPNCDNGQYYYEDPGYVEPWYPYNDGIPRACTDPASNPRGYYTANLSPCFLQFHKITDDGDDSPYQLSTACSDDNLVGGSSSSAVNKTVSAMLEYVSQWPDECVGDFKRCYTVSKDERIYIKEACSHNLVFPLGTTHVSLDCTDDKKMKQEAMDAQTPSDTSVDPYFQQEQDEIHEMEKVLFLILGVILVSCLGCLCAAYQLIIKPYQDTIKESRRTERDGLMMSNFDDDKATATSKGLSDARVV